MNDLYYPKPECPLTSGVQAGDICYFPHLYPVFFDPFIVIESLGYDVWDYEMLKIRDHKGEEKVIRSVGIANAMPLVDKMKDAIAKVGALIS